MKKSASFLTAVLALGLGSSAAHADVSVGVFYDSLDPYGDWVEVADYGYCWSPREVDSGWRPYTDGEWAYTDAGWTWVSSEPYGWAVYHYGRWLQTDSAGWVWVPGEEWGPAWVSWRRSPEYVGWAPLPPEARFDVSVGFSQRVDVEFDIGPAYYAFVTVGNFGAERLGSVIIEPQRNVTIINETRNITNITYVNNTVINRGPDYAVISKQSQRPPRKLKLNRRTDFSGNTQPIRGSAKIEGDSLNIPAPRFEKGPAAKPKKVLKQIAKGEVNRGWKGAGSEEAVQKVRAKMKQEENEPAVAEIATDSKAPARDPAQSPEARDPAKAEMKAERKAAKAAAAIDQTKAETAAKTSDASGKAAKAVRKEQKQAAAELERTAPVGDQPAADPEKPNKQKRERGDRPQDRPEGNVKPDRPEAPRDRPEPPRDRPEPPRDRPNAPRERPDMPKADRVRPPKPDAPRDLTPPPPTAPERAVEPAPEAVEKGKGGGGKGKNKDKDKAGGE